MKTKLLLMVVILGTSAMAQKNLTEDQKASYAFGISLGEQTESKNTGLLLTDSIDYKEMERGIQDYLKSGKTKESYAIGQAIGQTVESVIIREKLQGKLDPQMIVKGLMDVVTKSNNLLVEKDSASIVLQTYATKQHDILIAENLKLSEKFISEKQKLKGAKTTASGLVYVVQKEGKGKMPTENSTVSVKYTGKLMNGKVFDSTDKNGGQPIDLELMKVIPGWTEGLKLMKEGSKYTFYIKPQLGYGEKGQPRAGIQANDALEFDVELVGVKENAEVKKEMPIETNNQKVNKMTK